MSAWLRWVFLLTGCNNRNKVIKSENLKHWWYQTSQTLIHYIFQKSSRVSVQNCCAVMKGGMRLERAVPVHRRRCNGNI